MIGPCGNATALTFSLIRASVPTTACPFPPARRQRTFDEVNAGQTADGISQQCFTSRFSRGSRGRVNNTPVLVLVVVTALAFDFTNGFHDTANAMATSIATRALPPKLAVGLSSVLNLVGA